MKRTYLANVREEDGIGYQAFVYAKDLEAARNIDGVECVLYRVTPKEKSYLVENYGISQWTTDNN